MGRLHHALRAAAGYSPGGGSGASYESAVLADAPVAYYRCSETSGTSLADSSGNANGDATVYSPVTMDASTGFIESGSAVELEYSSSGASYISVPNPLNAGASFSIEMVVDGNTGNGECLAADSGTDYSWIIAWNPGNYGAGETKIYYANGESVTAYWPFFDGNQHHIIIAFDVENSEIRAYLDGALSDSFSVSLNPGQKSPIRVGKRLDSLAGIYDEIACYNYALNATQASDHYAALTGA